MDMAQRHTQSETAFRVHCEPREIGKNLSGAQMYSVPEVIRAMT